MEAADWTIVAALNGAIVAYGLLRGRDTKTSSDWFLAGRNLPWWMIGLSLYATVIDASDLVADSGGTYAVGVSYLVTNWVGVTGGWVLLANRIAIPMYRAGMYTNAEFLEARFGLAARVVSALVQSLYRTLVLGIMAATLYLVLAITAGLGAWAWWGVVGIAALAAGYTAFGGLRSVAVTDALQCVFMVASSVALFAATWAAAGGWSGAEARLDAHESGLSTQMLHVGTDEVARQAVADASQQEIQGRLLLGGEFDANAKEIVTTTPAWLVCLAWIILGLGYSVVNHTQSMRLFGARSERDMRLAVVVSGAILLGLNFTNLSIGILGRALFPDPGMMPLEASLQVRDSIFPLLVREVTSVGVRGIVVAGVVAATLSTFDSIGSTVPSLLVRDVLARVFVRNRPDSYYVAAGRLLTPVVILGSFGFVPMLLQERGMLMVLLDWVGAFVVPLLAVYLMGAFTRAHRTSAAAGLAAGTLYGALKLLAPYLAVHHGLAILPPVLVNNYASTVFSLVLTVGAMAAVTAVRGREPSCEPRPLGDDGWLGRSRAALQEPEPATGRDMWIPALLGAATCLIGIVLSFVVLW